MKRTSARQDETQGLAQSPVQDRITLDLVTRGYFCSLDWIGLLRLNALETGTTIVVNLVNGTYGYTIATNNKRWAASPVTRSVTVVGAAIAPSISFSQFTYAVTFTESNLPSGVTWYINSTAIELEFAVGDGERWNRDDDRGQPGQRDVWVHDRDEQQAMDGEPRHPIRYRRRCGDRPEHLVQPVHLRGDVHGVEPTERRHVVHQLDGVELEFAVGDGERWNRDDDRDQPGQRDVWVHDRDEQQAVGGEPGDAERHSGRRGDRPEHLVQPVHLRGDVHGVEPTERRHVVHQLDGVELECRSRRR